MSRTLRSIAQSNNAQSAEEGTKGRTEHKENKCKAGNKFSFKNKK